MDRGGAAEAAVSSALDGGVKRDIQETMSEVAKIENGINVVQEAA